MNQNQYNFKLILTDIQSIASKLNHTVLGTGHLSLALLANDDLRTLLIDMGFDLKKAEHEFLHSLQNNKKLHSDEFQAVTAGLSQIMEKITNMGINGLDTPIAPNILLMVLDQKETVESQILKGCGLNRLQLVNWLVEQKEKNKGKINENFDINNFDPNEHNNENNKSMLEIYAINLNEKSLNGKIDGLIGRDLEVDRVVEILSRRGKNNPLVVGEPGVGKTAIIEGLADKIQKGNVPKSLKEAKIYAVDLGGMIAGSKFRGEFEKRLKGVLEEAKKDPNIILFFDEIHTIIGSGAGGGSGAMDGANLIKPMINGGDIRIIGATTNQELRNIFEKDRALARRFQKIEVNEPSPEDAYNIIKGLVSKFEDFHKTKYTDKALRAAVDLTIRYIPDKLLPDKAIDVIDEAGARNKLKNKKEKVSVIDENFIGEIVARMAKIPSQNVSQDESKTLQNLEDKLKNTVFGQNEAIDILSSAIKVARSGLGDPNKPQGNFLFAGPTGVGKTEVTKQLAKELNMNLIRLDMSEYMEGHSVSKLIGSPPGYVGHEKGGYLTDAIYKTPHSVLLFDEIEKAHPDIFNILLQVMDYGKLTDANGRESDFRNTIIVMTTNQGAKIAMRPSIGFIQQDNTTDAMQAIKEKFSPEFRNRLDAVVNFKPLGIDEILKVVDKNILLLKNQLKEKNVEIELDDNARNYLAKTGFDPQMGARPMSRVIHNAVKKKLADSLLFGDLKNGGYVFITTNEKIDNLIIKTQTSKNESIKNESLIDGNKEKLPKETKQKNIKLKI